jgi:NDP-sugar pyrophosphorylase family protein
VRAAILAAGKGERLVRAGIKIDKPLIAIGGQPLITRVIDAAASVGAVAAACIINDLSPALHHHLLSGSWPLSVKVIRKTTRNSLESFTCLAPYLRGEPFLLFTVDAVFRPSALVRFLVGARHLGSGVLALTRFIDDEKPLYVDIGPDHAVRAVGRDVGASPYVTAGFYYFEPAALDFLPEAYALGLDSLREFFRFLCSRRYPLFGVRVSKTIDVDQPKDIEAAENYVMRGIGEPI